MMCIFNDVCLKMYFFCKTMKKSLKVSKKSNFILWQEITNKLFCQFWSFRINNRSVPMSITLKINLLNNAENFTFFLWSQNFYWLVCLFQLLLFTQFCWFYASLWPKPWDEGSQKTLESLVVHETVTNVFILKLLKTF